MKKELKDILNNQCKLERKSDSNTYGSDKLVEKILSKDSIEQQLKQIDKKIKSFETLDFILGIHDSIVGGLVGFSLGGPIGAFVSALDPFWGLEIGSKARNAMLELDKDQLKSQKEKQKAALTLLSKEIERVYNDRIEKVLTETKRDWDYVPHRDFDIRNVV